MERKKYKLSREQKLRKYERLRERYRYDEEYRLLCRKRALDYYNKNIKPYKKPRSYYVGENNPNWKGGVWSKEEKREYHREYMKEWRKKNIEKCREYRRRQYKKQCIKKWEIPT